MSVAAGESLYRTDRQLLNGLAPDVIVIQDVCDVCAVNATSAIADALRCPVHFPSRRQPDDCAGRRVMVATIVGAIVSVLTYFSSLDAARSFGTWALGSFRGTSWSEVTMLFAATTVGLSAAFAMTKSLDAMLLGDRYATSLGLNLRLVRLCSIVAAALCTGATTTFCGPIGFLGIAVPHLARGLVKTGRHRTLLTAPV